MTPLYFDVHVPAAIATQLRRRGVDVLTAQEDETTELKDHELLVRGTALGRLIFTQDIRFKAMAESWQREARTFAGLEPVMNLKMPPSPAFSRRKCALLAASKSKVPPKNGFYRGKRTQLSRPLLVSRAEVHNRL